MLKCSTGMIRGGAIMVSLVALTIIVGPLFSDPCGMVPPIYTGPGAPISRIGLQQTYVFFDEQGDNGEGVESFVIRPGFQGKVDNFGMLIPFPNPPSLRKVPDQIFDQIAKAADPPEVVIDLMPRPEMMAMNGAAPGGGGFGGGGLGIKRRQVKVLRKEAVGMYEVAVLAAGSAEALKRWMDKNEYQYPDGMDKVCEDYIKEEWCFVAVKTKVGEKSDADPKPGQRRASPTMPKGSIFDGNVQGLGFRFRTKELVVPMRLSAFNEGDLRNVVYLLTRGSKKIRSIPEEYVVRQIDGKELVNNLTKPLPVRIIGQRGGKIEIPKWRQQNLAQERDPEPHNGLAKQLFVSDILARSNPESSLKHEQVEKDLLQLGEHFGLRGKEIDREIEEVSKKISAVDVAKNTSALDDFTLTIVDGDFPREVLANENLRFADYRMPPLRNSPVLYDTKIHKAGGKKNGKLISHIFDAPGFKPGKLEFEFVAVEADHPEATEDRYIVKQVDPNANHSRGVSPLRQILALAFASILIGILVPVLRKK